MGTWPRPAGRSRATQSLLLLCAALRAPANTQEYPYKPVRYLVPFSAGGAVVGTSILARSVPHGYTTIMREIAHAANSVLHAAEVVGGPAENPAALVDAEIERWSRTMKATAREVGEGASCPAARG